MRELSLGTVLKAALLAGLAAGLAVAIFHFFATEPVLARAIAMEEQKHLMAGTPEEPPVVSREGQQVGLFIGFLIFGAVWALLLTVVYHVVQRWLPAAAKGRALLALAGWWSVSLIPFLKYPANPPGVGDPDTIGYRQALYFSFLLLSVAGTTLALILGRYLRATNSNGWRRSLVAPAFLLLFDLLIFAVIPNNPDAIGMPLGLVTTFRALSLAGLTLFWLIFGALFTWLLRAPSSNQAVLRPHTAGG
jgi:predicted cobalt transporter CbtA